MYNNPTLNLQKPKSDDFVPPRKNIFYSYLFSLFMAILYSRTHSPIIGIINVAVVLCAILTATKQECFLLLLGLQFVSRAITFDIGSTRMSFLLFAYAVIIIKYYITKNDGISKEFMVLVILFILEFINTLSLDSIPFFDIVVWLLSLWYMFEFLKGDINLDLHDVILYFCLGVWTICLIQILEEYFALGRTLDPNMYGKWLSYGESARLVSFAGRQIELRFGMAYREIAATNGLAFDVSLGICLCLFGLTAKHKKYRFFYAFTLISFFYFGFLTVSRGFYVEMLILFVLFAATATKRTDELFGYIVVGLVAVTLFFVFAIDNVDMLFDIVSDRFEAGDENRGLLIQNAIKVFFGNDRTLFFGSGSQYPYLWNFTAHNHIFDSLVALGSCGCLLYYTIIIKSHKKMKRYGQPFKLFNYIPLIMVISYRMISGRVSDIDFYYFLMVCFLLTQYNYEGEGEKGCITSH